MAAINTEPGCESRLRRAGIQRLFRHDGKGKEYLPHMYGHANWVEIDEVRKLPLKVADIYRRLTT